MRYLWATDHALSGDRFNALLPDFQAAEVDTGLTSALPPHLKPARHVA